MKTRYLLLTAVLALALPVACSSTDVTEPGDKGDETVTEPPTTPPNTQNPPPTQNGPVVFEEFVVDLIQNHTSDQAEPVAIPEDMVDNGDPNAFDVLFP